MAIDYSKWDRIELSDDSDIEVHPNVDKRSFIRMKQQDIHQKRIQRNNEINLLEVQIPMYEELNRRVDQMLEQNDDDHLSDYEGIQNYLLSTFDNAKPPGTEDDAPTYNEMIEDLIVQLKSQLEKAGQDPSNGSTLRAELKVHRQKIDAVLDQNKEKLKTLLKERELHISSEDIHTGFDRSFLNKGDSKTPDNGANTAIKAPVSVPSVPVAISSTTSAPAATITESAPTITPSQASDTHALTRPAHASVEDDDDNQISSIDPDMIALSRIPISKISEIKDFLKAHTHIINSSQKDALLMSAFDAQFQHDDSLTRQIISHSTLVQYIIDLINFKKAKYPHEIGIVIDGLFGKMFSSTSNPALEAFYNEVETTFAHIKKRCQAISEENAAEGVAEIQLKSLDDSTELVVNLPNPESDDPEEKKRYEIFLTLPKEMQEAIKTGSLDAVNEVFHGIPYEEAEQILEIFDEAEIIGVQALIEDENQWNEYKQDYQDQIQKGGGDEQQSVPRIEELDIKKETETEIRTSDIVD